MVIVVQFFPADDNSPRHDVRTCVVDLEIAVAEVVSDTVDDARGKDRNPQHLNCPDGQANGAE